MRLHLYEFNHRLAYADVPSFTIIAPNSEEAQSNAYDKFRDDLDLDEYSISLKCFDYWNDDDEETDDWEFDPTKEEDCPYIGEEEYKKSE